MPPLAENQDFFVFTDIVLINIMFFVENVNIFVYFFTGNYCQNGKDENTRGRRRVYLGEASNFATDSNDGLLLIFN